MPPERTAATGPPGPNGTSGPSGPTGPTGERDLLDSSARAGALRRLHVPGTPLVLPNVWDVPSARAVVAAGYPAVATSSEAVAGTLGYADGQKAPVGEMFAAAARIARAVDVPLTVDAEGGYGLAPVELVDRLLATGAVGCNLEDTDSGSGRLRNPSAQAEFLSAVRAAARAAGVPLVINARIDVYLKPEPEASDDALLEQAVRRALQYAAAGADCGYPILLHDQARAAEFCRAVHPLPVNLLGSYAPSPGRIALPVAAQAGAARVSFGPDLWAATLRALAALIPPIH